MLRQAHATSVIHCFLKFIARFLNIGTLAEAQLNEVMHLWTDLVYYARIHNLYNIAKIVTLQYGGESSTTFTDILYLPSIGRFTVGAVLSLAPG